METITKEKVIRIFRQKSISLFQWEDIFKLFNINAVTAKALIKRLKESMMIKPLAKGKYLFLLAETLPDDFELANFIYPPSYVSLESALSFYGIIDQFPYQITSVSLRKTNSFKIDQKMFTYAHLKPDLFKDYKKENNFLIASPQKAVFDFLYLVYKGGRGKGNLELLHLENERLNLNKNRVRTYIQLISRDQKFLSFCQNQKVI